MNPQNITINIFLENRKLTPELLRELLNGIAPKSAIPPVDTVQQLQPFAVGEWGAAEAAKIIEWIRAETPEGQGESTFVASMDVMKIVNKLTGQCWGYRECSRKILKLISAGLLPQLRFKHTNKCNGFFVSPVSRAA